MKQKQVIKIGHQSQAGKDIFLYENGDIVCGKFKYASRSNKEILKQYYCEIRDLADSNITDKVVDVSKVQYWDAMSIYDNYVVGKWVANISAKKMENLANETNIRLILKEIEPIFKQALSRKWKRIFRQSNPNSPDTPKSAWQIL